MTTTPKQDRPRGAKLGLVLALTLVVGGCLMFDRVYRGRAAPSPEEAPADRTLVLVHGSAEETAASRTAARIDREPPSERRRVETRATRPVDRETAPPPARSHLVAKGDSLYRLAEIYYGAPSRWQEIAKANGIREPYLIREGDRIRIP